MHAITARYAVAQRAQKSRMLDEYCATVQMSRKHATAHIGRAIKALADVAAGVSLASRSAPEGLRSTRPTRSFTPPYTI